MNQSEKIKNYMEQFGSITSMEAFRDLGITRLSARMMEIENQGVPLERSSETSLNRFGEKVHFTRYSFAKVRA